MRMAVSIPLVSLNNYLLKSFFSTCILLPWGICSYLKIFKAFILFSHKMVGGFEMIRDMDKSAEITLGDANVDL
jgi:hypothetical protein